MLEVTPGHILCTCDWPKVALDPLPIDECVTEVRNLSIGEMKFIFIDEHVSPNPELLQMIHEEIILEQLKSFCGAIGIPSEYFQED